MTLTKHYTLFTSLHLYVCSSNYFSPFASKYSESLRCPIYFTLYLKLLFIEIDKNVLNLFYYYFVYLFKDQDDEHFRALYFANW